MAKLINKETKQELTIGQEVECFRGDKYILTGFREPHKPSSTGRVYVKAKGDDFTSQYFPSVINAEIIDHNCEGESHF